VLDYVRVINFQIIIIIFFIFWSTSTKRQARILEVKQNNDHSVLLGVRCAQKGDRIPSLECYRQSLKKEHRFSRVLGDCSDASALLLYEFDRELVPCVNCHREKDVSGGQRTIFDHFAGRWFIGSCTWFSGSVA